MKKWMMLLISAALLFTAASAEGEDPVQKLETGKDYKLDLNGDGIDETVCAKMESFDREGALQIQVRTENGPHYYDTYIIFNEEIYAADVDGDGVCELLVTGDEASADYFTWCLKFNPEKGIYAVPFANADRGVTSDEYFDAGYGRIESIEGNVITVSGSRDTLGTWWCGWQYALRDGRFELVDGRRWKVVEEVDESEVWEFRCLTLTRELEMTTADGDAVTLQPGEKFTITEFDEDSALIRTQSGLTGILNIAPDEERGWGSLINGISEDEYFEFVPYAD